MEKRLKATLDLLKELGFEEFYSFTDIKHFTVPTAEKDKLTTPSYERNSKSIPKQENKNKLLLLKELYEKNKNCCRCELCKSRSQIVFFDGNPTSKVMFVGEAPGEEEDKQGKPFVGRAGQYLNKVLEKIGLDRNAIYITNVCKCRPPGNRKPTPKEMQTCLNVFLKKEVEIIQPKVICCLGATAAEAFLGKNVKITRMRGQFYPNPLFPKTKLFLTYHPAYVLRNMREAKTFESDLRKLKEYLEKLGLN